MSEPRISRGTTVTRPLEIGGRKRSFLVHLPPDYDPKDPPPLVLAFHGATSNGPLMERFSGLSDKADREGFVVVYPNGTGNTERVLTWNGGSGQGYAGRHQIDDVGFVRTLLHHLEHILSIDPARIYATGMSNGAQMAYRLAFEMSDRIAAIAAVAGPMGGEFAAPARPVSVLHIHGTNDEFAPFEGGVGPRTIYGTEFISVERTIQTWAKLNGCPGQPRVVEETPREDDGTRIIRHDYAPCGEGAEVVLVVVEGGGHTWPGRPPLPASLGKSTRNLNANDLMWEFFQGKTRT